MQSFEVNKKSGIMDFLASILSWLATPVEWVWQLGADWWNHCEAKHGRTAFGMFCLVMPYLILEGTVRVVQVACIFGPGWVVAAQKLQAERKEKKRAKEFSDWQQGA